MINPGLGSRTKICLKSTEYLVNSDIVYTVNCTGNSAVAYKLSFASSSKIALQPLDPKNGLHRN